MFLQQMPFSGLTSEWHRDMKQTSYGLNMHSC